MLLASLFGESPNNRIGFLAAIDRFSKLGFGGWGLDFFCTQMGLPGDFVVGNAASVLNFIHGFLVLSFNL